MQAGKADQSASIEEETFQLQSRAIEHPLRTFDVALLLPEVSDVEAKTLDTNFSALDKTVNIKHKLLSRMRHGAITPCALPLLPRDQLQPRNAAAEVQSWYDSEPRVVCLRHELFLDVAEDVSHSSLPRSQAQEFAQASFLIPAQDVWLSQHAFHHGSRFRPLAPKARVHKNPPHGTVRTVR
jgi:hypothetical protein